MSKRTYYRGPDAVVTDRLFVWHTTPAKGFAIQDLRNVGLVRTGAVAVAVPFLLLAGFSGVRSRRWELRATYRGHDVVLYSTSDTRVFNQVARALRRAVEDARPPIRRHQLAS